MSLPRKYWYEVSIGKSHHVSVLFLAKFCQNVVKKDLAPFYEWSFPKPNGIHMNLTFINFYLGSSLEVEGQCQLQWTKKQQENTFTNVHFGNVFNITL